MRILRTQFLEQELVVNILKVFRLPKMNNNEIAKLIGGQFLCRIAFVGEEYPHIAPFQYVFLDGTLYFHFTDYGRKVTLLEKDKGVCVEIEEYEPDLNEFKFVVLKGKLEIVNDSSERERIIETMAEQGKRMLSENFLTAHGLKKEEGWSAFSSEKPFIIVKLNASRVSGLKSP
jgi:nitroimidazol reductase NimA-like FMN-containing flavoprotein (pyridoxamine 5'-phosphate oxidase superfamily)